LNRAVRTAISSALPKPDPSTAINTGRDQDAMACGDRLCGGARLKPGYDEGTATPAPNHQTGPPWLKPKHDETMPIADDRLRVHGLQNSLVMEVSVIPAVTSANTNAPSIRIAE
jgi:choline dehydrogenase-like flavoprotein